MMRFLSGFLLILVIALGSEAVFANSDVYKDIEVPVGYSARGFCNDIHGFNACQTSGSTNARFLADGGTHYIYYIARPVGYCEDNGLVAGDDNVCTDPPAPTPDDCFEQGQVYDSSSQSCSSECSGSLISGFCFSDDNPNDPFQNEDCSSDSPDWQGTIGFGDSQTNVCSGQSNCSEGQTYGVVNGKQTCVNNDFGLPECGSGQYASVDDYGASCNSFDSGPPNDPLPPPEPNTDTDADGTPDEYRPENDPNATTNAVNTVADGVSGLQDLQNEANDTADKTLKAIDRLRKENNSRLDTLIDQGANPELPENAKLSEKSLIPTFAESASAFSAAVASNSAIQLVGNIVVPTSSTCPVYTLPATPISSPITMDIHCSILANHSGLISSMFLFAWSLLGLTIFLKA